MEHQEGRPQVENLFARRITSRAQLLGWDVPRDPEVIAYEIWAAGALNRGRPAVEDLHRRLLHADAFPDLGDGRHYLLVKHDLSAPWDCIVFLRAINLEHHGDPATHTHLASDYEVDIDARLRVDGHRDPPLRVTLTATDGTQQWRHELSSATGLIGMTIPHHGSIEELAFLFHAPHYSLVRSEGIRTPIERRIVNRTAQRASGGKFLGNRALPNGIPVHVLRRPKIIPKARLYHDDGQLRITPHVQVELSADYRPLPAVGAELADVWPSPDGERVELRAEVVALGTGRNGAPAADVVIEGRAASLIHARLLAAFRRETGALV